MQRFYQENPNYVKIGSKRYHSIHNACRSIFLAAFTKYDLDERGHHKIKNNYYTLLPQTVDGETQYCAAQYDYFGNIRHVIVVYRGEAWDIMEDITEMFPQSKPATEEVILEQLKEYMREKFPEFV